MLTKFVEQFKEKGETYLRIKARPGANATEVRGIMEGEEGETIKIDVAAVPENGKANLELIKYLAKWFLVVKKNVKIVSGAGDKVKLIKIVK
ncbi:MAG: hypothetical protein US81_C0013G0007 [Parcubacteria group bacterium GW2011_GWE2_38_18]|nr:MAG: hypothetical protein US81_C0013G0007 [Parcubacteria group bacterium GW2011_GWE2_38_18]